MRIQMVNSPTTQVSLILRLQNSEDADAWERFVSIYHPMIWNIAKRLGLTDEDASDACQNALLRLTQVVHQWSPNVENPTFRGWLFRVARNCMLRQFQQEKKQAIAAVDSEGRQFLDQLALDSDKGESAFRFEFQRQVFARAIELVRPTVKELYWNAFCLTYVENKSIKDAAKILDTGANTVYVARHRVLNRIREEAALISDEEWECQRPPEIDGNPIS
jgi:RNA polymerase sigma-70 factor (ECF subfamily)